MFFAFLAFLVLSINHKCCILIKILRRRLKMLRQKTHDSWQVPKWCLYTLQHQWHLSSPFWKTNALFSSQRSSSIWLKAAEKEGEKEKHER